MHQMNGLASNHMASGSKEALSYLQQGSAPSCQAVQRSGPRPATAAERPPRPAGAPVENPRVLEQRPAYGQQLSNASVALRHRASGCCAATSDIMLNAPHPAFAHGTGSARARVRDHCVVRALQTEAD